MSPNIPMVSTLKMSYFSVRMSKRVYSRSSMSHTFSGATVRLMSVKPTMSEKKMVTLS